MRRKTGPGDISYCNTNCTQEKCKRNLRYWKAPTQFYSVVSFDENCKDELHLKCKHILSEEENSGRRIKTTKSRKP